MTVTAKLAEPRRADGQLDAPADRIVDLAKCRSGR